MTATTSKLGADMLNDELKSNPLFEALKLAVGMLSLHGYEDEAKKVVAEARLARQPAAIDKQCTCKGVLGHSRQCAMFDESMMSIAAPLANEESKPAAQQTLSDGAQFFACYLIDNCENEVVREESVQAWLGKMLASPRYHPAAPSVEQDERGASNADIAAAATQHCYARTAARGWIFGHVSELRAFIRAASTSANVRDERGAFVIDSGAALKVAERFGFPLNAKTVEFAQAIVKRAGELQARAASTSANVAQYRNEALSALLVDHSHAASAKDVDAVLKARDAIYSMFANVAQGAEAVGLVMTNDKGEKYGALLDSNIEERTKLYAAPPAQTAITDDARDSIIEAMARAMNMATDGHERYWSGYVKSAEAAFDAALTAAQSASGDTK